MHPTTLDVTIIQSLAPLQHRPWLVAAADAATQNSFLTVPFALPLFLLWHRAPPDRQVAAQRLVITVLVATIIGALTSLCLQQVIRWPPPAVAPATSAVYAPLFRNNVNLNSFPSDSTILYSTVAFGILWWSRPVGFVLLFWLLLAIVPLRIFVGGHYPIDIAAGLLIGFGSTLAARRITRSRPLFTALAASCSPVLASLLFLWLFEVGKGFSDVRQIANALSHLARHLWRS